MNSYLKKMLYALTSAYSHRKDYDNLQSDKPVETNIGKLFSIFAWGLDKVQEQADLIKLWDNLDYAEGKVLDRYGANFGVKRGGASDLLYRLFIKVKMIAQLSSGDEDTVIKAAAEFLGVEYSDIYSEDVYPAKKRIYVDLSLLSDERRELIEQIGYAIKRTIAAGVGFRLYLRTYRTYKMPLPISRGVFSYVVDIGTDAGARRTKTLPVDMLRAGRVWSLSRGDIPPNVPRNYEQPFEVAHGGFFERGIEGYYPDTQDVIQSSLDIARGANIERQFETYMPDAKKTFDLDAGVKRGGFLERKVGSYYPDAQNISQNQINVSKGAHIEHHTEPYMPNSQNTSILGTNVAHGGFLERGVDSYYPDVQSSSRSDLEVSRGGSVEHHVETMMPDGQQAHDLDASVKHGGFLRDERQAAPSGDKRVVKGKAGNSGAMCITRIKPRRIE